MKLDFKVCIYLVLCGVLLVGCQNNSLNAPKSENILNVKINTEQESNQVDNEAKDDETDINENTEINENAEINEKETMEDEEKNQVPDAEQLNMETKILVYKKERKLELWQNDELTNSYLIGLAENVVGRKEKEGDRLTPEGEYYVCTRNQYSKYYLSLGVSYPNMEDAKKGLESGLIDEETYTQIENAIQKKECPPWYTALGGEIMIHGHGGSKDWTKGCIAVDDEVMDVLWDVCQLGTLIIIYP